MVSAGIVFWIVYANLHRTPVFQQYEMVPRLLVLGSVIPFTLIFILPTNKRLLSPTLDRRSPQTERLLAHWAALHAVRTVLSGLALLLFLFVLIFTKAR